MVRWTTDHFHIHLRFCHDRLVELGLSKRTRYDPKRSNCSGKHHGKPKNRVVSSNGLTLIQTDRRISIQLSSRVTENINNDNNNNKNDDNPTIARRKTPKQRRKKAKDTSQQWICLVEISDDDIEKHSPIAANSSCVPTSSGPLLDWNHQLDVIPTDLSLWGDNSSSSGVMMSSTTDSIVDLLFAETPNQHIWCLYRQTTFPVLSVVKPLISLYTRSPIFYHILGWTPSKCLKRTINSRDRARTTPYRSATHPDCLCLLTHGCVDCSSLILYRTVSTDEDGLIGICTACERVYDEGGTWYDLPHFRATREPVEITSDYEPCEEDIELVRMWSRLGDIGISFIFTILSIIGPNLECIVERRLHERLCGLCGLGVIAGFPFQRMYQCTWCGTANRSVVPQSNLKEGLIRHRKELATALSLAIQQSNLIAGETYNSDLEPQLAPIQSDEQVHWITSMLNLNSEGDHQDESIISTTGNEVLVTTDADDASSIQ